MNVENIAAGLIPKQSPISTAPAIRQAQSLSLRYLEAPSTSPKMINITITGILTHLSMFEASIFYKNTLNLSTA
ncbi:MAG: hypothetical protein ACD_47C00498G0001 [uncultured bacterium]|nr:MAG: hypothetical protein ACD_47C00498G0001 [uncultured bacterium]